MERMQIEDAARPVPREGQVLIEGYTASLNPVDYKTGTSGVPGWTYPHVLGLDVAGIIAEVGPNVSQVKVSDRVVYHSDWREWGAFAQFTLAKVHMVVPIPDEVSFAEAVALPTAGFTAYQALHQKIPMHAVESILVHAGACGVGGFAIQLAKRLGKTVYTTASRHNHDLVRSLGAHYAFDYKEENWVERIMEITNGHGVDVVLDAVGSENATLSLDVIAYNGHIAHIAGAPDMSKVKPFTQVISSHEIALNAIHHQNDRKSEEVIVEIGEDMLDMV
ncbi:zinc-binding dehydrogenase [Paenibacillus herberti]|uniref:zinc-binding dehydrogenase n=1 Tax=Paenibacillus herberti TaxID=1619309 RepID=UPI001FE74418|nr:zinc-binding dehydrogenase [Paenibacillus herberti]